MGAHVVNVERGQNACNTTLRCVHHLVLLDHQPGKHHLAADQVRAQRVLLAAVHQQPLQHLEAPRRHVPRRDVGLHRLQRAVFLGEVGGLFQPRDQVLQTGSQRDGRHGINEDEG
jgi:hypothetical protein